MFVTRLRDLRERSNKTQKEIADILGVARTTYASYEQGKKEPDYGILIKISLHYKVTTDYLLCLTDIRYDKSSISIDEIEFISESLDVYRKIKNKFSNK